MSKTIIHREPARTHGLFGCTSLKQAAPTGTAIVPHMEQALKTSLPINSQSNNTFTCGTTGDVAQLGQNGLAMIVGNPFWKTGDLKEIAKKQGHAEALIKAYHATDGNPETLIAGAFSFALIDPSSTKAILGIDRLGQYPLYYLKNGDELIFGTTANCILAHPSIKREIDPQGIYNYVYFHMVPSPSSIFKGLKKLPAGHIIEFDDHNIKLQQYWFPDFQEYTPGNFTTLKNELRHTLTRSVKRAIGKEPATGAFLSGGLDSSTVTGMLSEARNEEVEAFSIGFSAEGYDEMSYARITAKHFNVKLHEYYVTPNDIVDALPLVATSYDEPFGNSSALPAWFCAKLAKDNGIQRLLAGDGGDEIFAGNERYARQTVFERYHRIPAALRNNIIEPAVNGLPFNWKLAEKALSYIDQANTPLPDRLQSYNFLHRHSPAEIFNKNFLEAVNTEQPLFLQREIYDTPKNASDLNRMLYLDWQYTLADNDLRKVSHMCALADIDVAYPMLDDQLVNFSCTIPSKQKLNGKNLRDFYKKSLTGWLPDQTINKSKQGFGLPFGIWMQEHKPLQEMVYDNLLALKKREYFNPEFINQLIDLHRTGHAAYYGELIWILAVLELWMSGQCQ